jgi:hypothetical protein
LLPVVYIITPYVVLLPSQRARVVGILLVMVLKAFAIIVAFPSTTILLTNSCLTVRVLGTLNGFATMFSGLGRAFGPASTGWVFSWGVDHGYVVSPWFFLAFVALIGSISVFMIVEGDGPSVSVENSDAEDSETAVGSDADDDEADDRTGLLRRDSTLANSEGGREPLLGDSNHSYSTMSNRR